MIQFYFLSVLLNLVGGYALALDPDSSRSPAIDDAKRLLRDPTVRLVLGILAAVTGGFKLLTVVRGDIPVVGDFLPAVAGLAVGSALLLELYRAGEVPAADEAAAAGNPGEAKAPGVHDRLEGLILGNKAAIGIAGMIAGLVHFLFPMVLFL